jgi:hypothetical protein
LFCSGAIAQEKRSETFVYLSYQDIPVLGEKAEHEQYLQKD